MMVASSQSLPALHLKSETTLIQKSKGDCTHTYTDTVYSQLTQQNKVSQIIVKTVVFQLSITMPLKWNLLLLFFLLFLLIVWQCCDSELLLSAPPSAAPPTLPSSLHPVLPAGGAVRFPVLGAHLPTEQTARSVDPQLPGSEGVSLHIQHVL